jgi:hypothetical protein
MTINEFFDKLGSRHKIDQKKWIVTKSGMVRCESTKQCPISYMASSEDYQFSSAKWREASAELGLNTNIAHSLALAADRVMVHKDIRIKIENILFPSRTKSEYEIT